MTTGQILSSRPITPGEVAAAGGGVQLYDASGRLMQPETFRSPFNFGPGTPLQPRFPEFDRTPWEWQYPQAWNLMPTPRAEKHGGKRFEDLRAYATLVYYARIAINYRKSQVTGLKWRVQAKGENNSKSAREKFKGDIEPLEEFFRKPNRLDNLSFHQFVKQALEEILVTDALTFWVHPSVDGTPHSYVQIDGGTIKPLIDEFGHVIAYQQILYGYPAVEYAAAYKGDGGDLLEPGALRYCVYNPVVDDVYGRSPLEEITPLLDIAIRRQVNQLAWYTDGNIPTATMEAPPEWSVETINQAQSYYDRLFSGDQTQRHKVRIVPSGSNFQTLKPFEFSKDEEEAIVAAVCGHFGVPRTLFMSETNRATAKQLSEDATDVGFRPLRQFLADYMTNWINDDFSKPDLEFVWVLEETGSEKEKAESLSMYVNAGIMTDDEARAKIDLDPMPEELKKPKLLPGQSPFGQPGQPPPKPGQAQPPEQPPKGQPPEKPKEKQPPPEEKAVVDELRTWERFAAKRVAKGRQTDPFETAVVPETMKAAINQALKVAGSEREIKALFDVAVEKARKRLNAAAKHRYERDLKQVITRHLADQKQSVLEHYRHAAGK